MWASPRFRSRGWWSWRNFITLKKLLMPRCSMWTSAACRKIAIAMRSRRLREVDTIAHVIRVFDDPSVPHAAGSIDPLRDATNLELELILADHDQSLAGWSASKKI